MTLRLKFNKPAVRTFFEGTGATAITLKLDGDRIMMKPVRPEDGMDDAIAITEQGQRGGLTAEIDGSREGELVQFLRPSQGNVYFTLRRNMDWIDVEPTVGEPHRQEPTMRVWFDETNRPIAPHIVTAMNDLALPAFIQEVEEAMEIIAHYEQNRRQGRLPREVSDAKEKVRLAQEFARKVLPLDNLRQAAAQIELFLEGEAAVSH